MGTEARKIYDDWILVAPYWNLNTEVTAPKPRTVKILVAPYWNLNS